MALDPKLVREVGGGVVVEAHRLGGDVLNAWEVLYEAFGFSTVETERAVERACVAKGVAFDDVHRAVQGALNDRRS